MSMHPLDSLIKEEFKQIAKSSQYSLKYSIKCTIHAPNENIEALFVTDFSLLRDYVNNFSDVLSITAVFGAGTLNHRIVPFGKNLEATVTLRPLANVPAYIDSKSSNIRQYRYRAILYENSVQAIENNLVSDQSAHQRDKEDVSAVSFQLVNPVQERLRTVTFGGSIRDAIPMEAIRMLLTKYSRFEGDEDAYRVYGVNVVPGYSEQRRNHILVPHLTPLIKLPLVIEQSVGGIYKTGFQYYLQGNMWFIFSPYDVKAYEKSENKLTVINVPKNKLAQMEKTFRVTPTQVILLSTGEVKFNRISDRSEYNETFGTKFVSAKNVLGSADPSGGFGVTGGNKFIINRGDNINDFTTQPTQDVTHAKESSVRITSHLFREYSEISFRRGAFLQFIWENGVDALLYPGMPLRFIYMDAKTPKQVYGTVVAVDSAYMPESKGIIQKKFSTRLVVSCFVEDTIKNSEMM